MHSLLAITRQTIELSLAMMSQLSSHQKSLSYFPSVGSPRTLCVPFAAHRRSVKAQAISSRPQTFEITREAVAALFGAAMLGCCQPALADLNKYEAEAGFVSADPLQLSFRSCSICRASARILQKRLLFSQSIKKRSQLGLAAKESHDCRLKHRFITGGEFGIGSALQYGEADIKGKDFHGQVLMTDLVILQAS